MKKISLTILFAAALAFAGSHVIISCGPKSHEDENEHVEVEALDDDANHQHESEEGEEHEHEGDDDDSEELAYACPMHPEEKGNEGDTCSKCKMALVKIETETEE